MELAYSDDDRSSSIFNNLRDTCVCVATSTPNNTRELPEDSEISIISPQQPEFPDVISDDVVEEALRALSAECHQQSYDVDVHEQSTLRLDTPDHSQSPRSRSGSPLLEMSPRNENVDYDQSPGRKSRSSGLDETEIIRNENEIPKTKDKKSPRRQNMTLMPAQNDNDMLSSISEKSARKRKNQTSVSPRQREKHQENYMRSEHLSTKNLSISENTEGSSIDCQPLCPCDEEDTRSSSLPTTSEMSTVTKSNQQWWLFSPEEVKKALQAIRQSFMGRTEDDTNIRFKALESTSTASTSNGTENVANLQTEDSTHLSSDKLDISDYNLRRQVKIRVPQKKNKCNFCENYQSNPEVENIESTETTGEFSSPSSNKKELNLQNKRKKSVTIQMPSKSDKSQTCDICECKDDKHGGHSKNLKAKNSEKVERNQEDEPQFSKELKEGDKIQNSTDNQSVEEGKIQNSNDNQSVEEGKIQNPCDICDPSIQCEEEDFGADQTIKESQKSDTAQAIEDGSDNYCYIVEDDEECRTRDQEVRNPEGNRSQTAESLTFEDNRDLKPMQKLMNKLKKKLEKESGVSGGGSSCAGVCERYYREKLMATLQILENKDETIRIQGSSLGVAEGRIAELTKRASALQADLELKARELSQLRQFADSYRADKSDVSIMAEMEDAEVQKRVVATLEDNLAVIAELYRECFYETAKQEDLIELLRKSYLEVRMMERDKSDRITRLQNVINTQKRSIEQCQDVVIEVESLKSEISSFLNSSNNDSGMWERGSESGDVSEELADILEQLRQLQDMLTGDCICGLEEENKALKERNEGLEMELNKARQRNIELDSALRQLLEQQYEKRIKEKDRQLEEANKRLAEMENDHKERRELCETLSRQLQETQVILDDKSAELAAAQQKCAAQEAAIRRLEQDLDMSEQQIKEGIKKFAEASQAHMEQRLQSQAMTSDLEQRLQIALQRCQELEMSCREKQCSLEEAHTRGAQLCEESRRVTGYVRQWMRRKRQLAREQQEKIERQESMLRELQLREGSGQNTAELTSQSETDPSNSNSIPREYASASDTSYPRCSRTHKPTCKSETSASRWGSSMARCVERKSVRISCPKCEFNRREFGSDMASCSKCTFNVDDKTGSCAHAQAPLPPRRQKRQSYEELDHQDCPCSPRESSSRLLPDTRWVQLPRHHRLLQRSPTEELLERLEHLNAAMAAGQRRRSRSRR